jgi:hypothetical protein
LRATPSASIILIWPGHAFEAGIGINLLISAEPGLPRDGAVFHDTSVWLRPASGVRNER